MLAFTCTEGKEELSSTVTGLKALFERYLVKSVNNTWKKKTKKSQSKHNSTNGEKQRKLLHGLKIFPINITAKLFLFTFFNSTPPFRKSFYNNPLILQNNKLTPKTKIEISLFFKQKRPYYQQANTRKNLKLKCTTMGSFDGTETC